MSHHQRIEDYAAVRVRCPPIVLRRGALKVNTASIVDFSRKDDVGRRHDHIRNVDRKVRHLSDSAGTVHVRNKQIRYASAASRREEDD